MNQAWDIVASTYAEDAEQWTVYIEEALRIVPVHAGERILDVAAGPGTLSFRASPVVTRADAVDYSPGMIHELKARAARDGFANVHGAVMNAEELAFPDATFDAAYCIFAFFFFPDRARAFRELYRVLRPGGRALIATWATIERRPFMKIGFDAMAEAFPQAPRPAKGDLQEPEECVREMSAAGFEEVTATRFVFSTRIDSADHYVHLLSRSAAPLAAMKKQMGSGWESARQRLVDAVAKRLPGDAKELSAEAIFTHGIRPARG